MFTGIVETIGLLKEISRSQKGATLAIESLLPMNEIKLGDSISVSGVCLTVTKIQGQIFHADISAETLSKTNFNSISSNALVHLERALKFNGRIDGHIVTGHVDATGTVRKIENQNDSSILEIYTTNNIINSLVPKGSIAINGVSLTLNNIYEDYFDVTIVPYTKEKTIFKNITPNTVVNLETDILGKYVEKFLKMRFNDPTFTKSQQELVDFSKTKALTYETLAKNSFI